MTVANLEAELVYDRCVSPEFEGPVHSVSAWLENWFRSQDAEWADSVVMWDVNPKQRKPVDVRTSGKLAEAVTRGTTLLDGSMSGSTEIRTAQKDYIVIVSVDDEPLRTIGGRLLLGNALHLQLVRKRVGKQSATEFAEAFLLDACTYTWPVWGAICTRDEYYAKVMQTSPSIEAVGRDFGKFLPGLFALNYFGRPYVNLLGEGRLAGVGEGNDGTYWGRSRCPCG